MNDIYLFRLLVYSYSKLLAFWLSCVQLSVKLTVEVIASPFRLSKVILVIVLAPDLVLTDPVPRQHHRIFDEISLRNTR